MSAGKLQILQINKANWAVRMSQAHSTLSSDSSEDLHHTGLSHTSGGRCQFHPLLILTGPIFSSLFYLLRWTQTHTTGNSIPSRCSYSEWEWSRGSRSCEKDRHGAWAGLQAFGRPAHKPGAARHACQLLISGEMHTVLRAAFSTDAGGSSYGNLMTIFLRASYMSEASACYLFIAWNSEIIPSILLMVKLSHKKWLNITQRACGRAETQIKAWF